MMGGRRILSDEAIAEMADLREAGRSYGFIQQHFAERGVHISVQALRWQCLRVGADVPPRHRVPMPHQAGQTLHVIRGGKPFVLRRFTAEEDRLILRLEAQGVGYAEIGRCLSPARPFNSIKGRVLTLARHQARAEEAA